jgi:Dehydrogenases (flavoproteins)
MEHYDVVVVGGGPAGLSAGVKCAENGVKTLIIEKDPIDTAKKSLDHLSAGSRRMGSEGLCCCKGKRAKL